MKMYYVSVFFIVALFAIPCKSFICTNDDDCAKYGNLDNCQASFCFENECILSHIKQCFLGKQKADEHNSKHNTRDIIPETFICPMTTF